MVTTTITMFKQFIVIHVLLALLVWPAKITLFLVTKATTQIEQQLLVVDVHLVTIVQLKELQNFKCFHRNAQLVPSVVQQ